MHYLTFDLSEDDAGTLTIEALASTPAAQHAAVMAEARRILEWARARFPDTHGPLDEGMDWDDDLQVQVEDGGWHSVALTLAASARFAEAFREAFPGALGEAD